MNTRIMVASLCRYERIKEKAVKTGGNINRSEEEGAGIRYKKTKTKERDQFQEKRRKWRRTGGAEPAPPMTSVLFVPKTQGSGLAKRLQEAEHRLSVVTRERVTERGGKSMLQLLHTNDPFAGAPCGRDTCVPCNNNVKAKKEDCNMRNILHPVPGVVQDQESPRGGGQHLHLCGHQQPGHGRQGRRPPGQQEGDAGDV